MLINEFHTFNMKDAVKFHSELNPKLFNPDKKMDPEVKEQLLLIAQDFITELGIKDLDVEDVTVSGSNAAYSYTDHSDLDLHILVDFDKLPNDEVYQELFNAKKLVYNDSHDITVRGIPVELYVQDSNQPHISLGEYSILHDKWLRVPTKDKSNFNQHSTKAKYEKLLKLIQLSFKLRDLSQLSKVTDIIKRYRQAGLDTAGEFGPENLAYKALRNQGYIKKLYDLKNELHSEKLSIDEVLDTKTKAPFYNTDGGPLDRAVPFKTKSGNRYEIEFINALDAYSRPRLRQFPKIKPKLIYYKDEIIDNGVEVVFRQDDYMLDNPAGITGAGSAAEVFGVVTNKIIEFIKKFNPPYLYFTSYDDEPSRIKLYNALLRRVVPTLRGYFYKAIKIENSYQFVILDSDFFEVSPNVNVNENIEKVDGGWLHTGVGHRYNYKTDSYPIYPLPRFNTYLGYRRYDLGTFNDVVHYMYFLLTNYLTKNIEITGQEIADTLAKLGNKNSKEQLDLMNKKNGTDWKSWDQFFEAFREHENEKFYKAISNFRLEENSGYIPSEKEKNDPRFKTALTVDVKPDSIKKNAKAFGWKVSRAGIPPLLRK